MTLGTFLKGSGTQKQPFLSLADQTPRLIRGTCCPAAHISTCADTLCSNFWNSLSALMILILKPWFLKTVRTFSIPLMMSLGPRLYVIQGVFLLRLLIRLKDCIAWNLILADFMRRYGAPCT